MSGLRALIVEDEAPARRYLGELLAGTGRVAVAAAVATPAEATEAVAALELDVAFVDIRLVDRPGDTSGLVWARELARGARPLALVFATALADHALAAFELGGVDYLLKPYTRARVATCVERLVQRAPPRPALAAPTKLVARTATSLLFLVTSGVLAFEASERLAFVHHTSGRFLVDLSLAALEAQFAEVALRTHRNWLVVLEHVRELDRAGGEVVLRVGDGLVVPVARERAAAVREVLVARALGNRR